MSYTHFHHWGARTQDQIQRLQQATDYGTAYRTTEPRLLDNGQIVIDRGIEGVYMWSKNPIQSGGVYYNGAFLNAECSQWWADALSFENKWYSVHDTSLSGINDEIAFEGVNSSDAEMAIGISINTLYGSTTTAPNGDYLALKNCGLVDCDYDGINNPDIGDKVEEGNSAGKCDISTSGANIFGWITSRANQSGTGGSVLIKVNLTETA